MRRQSPSPKARKGRKSQGLPLSVAVYMDDHSTVIGLKSPQDKLRSSLVSRLEEERKRLRRTIRPALLPGRVSLEKPRPESELAAFDLLDYQEKCEIATNQLQDLDIRCQSIHKANTFLRKSLALQAVRKEWGRQTLSNEIEDLYALLSGCHASLSILGERKEQVGCEIGRMQQEAGVMRYSLELTENTQVVKENLLKEALEKRITQQTSLKQEVCSLEEECESLDQEIASLTQGNMELESTCEALESRSDADTLHLANLHQSMCVTTALLLYSQAQVVAWEDFIRAHTY